MSVPASIVIDIQNELQKLGQSIEFIPAGGASSAIQARVRYLTANELANSIENYSLEVSVDARDFQTPPAKGDTFVIDGARRGVMSVRAVRMSGLLVGYHVGVAG